jgi:peptidoglycan/LPS O-acetylase OafA/YrhL
MYMPIPFHRRLFDFTVNHPFFQTVTHLYIHFTFHSYIHFYICFYLQLSLPLAVSFYRLTDNPVQRNIQKRGMIHLTDKWRRFASAWHRLAFGRTDDMQKTLRNFAASF